MEFHSFLYWFLPPFSECQAPCQDQGLKDDHPGVAGPVGDVMTEVTVASGPWDRVGAPAVPGYREMFWGGGM